MPTIREPHGRIVIGVGIAGDGGLSELRLLDFAPPCNLVVAAVFAYPLRASSMDTADRSPFD
jgi:hypothetical protein